MRSHDSAVYVDSRQCGSSIGFGTELAWDAWLDDLIGGKTVKKKTKKLTVTLTAGIKITL